MSTPLQPSEHSNPDIVRFTSLARQGAYTTAVAEGLNYAP